MKRSAVRVQPALGVGRLQPLIDDALEQDADHDHRAFEGEDDRGRQGAGKQGPEAAGYDGEARRHADHPHQRHHGSSFTAVP